MIGNYLIEFDAGNYETFFQYTNDKNKGIDII
jgi:hypothetical protein